MPGSGKTNLAERVTKRLNERQVALQPNADSGPIAAYCPMDGYHYTKAELDKFENPAEAHFRRGAEHTFDGRSFLDLVKSLRAPLDTATTQSIFAPSFDHAAGDPVDDDIEVRPSHRIVVFEGNYVCLDMEPWRTAANLMDLRWFVEVDKAVATRRLARRHVNAGIVKTIEDGVKRAETNDLVNGLQICANKVENIDATVWSKEDADWAPNWPEEEESHERPEHNGLCNHSSLCP